MSNTNSEVSIIIVNYNTEGYTHACLQSILRVMRATDQWEIILVDNGSTDDSKAALWGYVKKNPILKSITKLIESPTNGGFSAGNNLGIKIASGKYILLLNSDTEVMPEAIQTVVNRIAQDPDIGAATCKLILPNGDIDPACHRGFPSPWAALTYFFGFEKVLPRTRLFGQYHMGYKQMDREHDVDAISGAFFMVKRSVIEKVGLLDESYFMYGEDLDWAYRINRAGYKIVYIPQVWVLHRKKQSGRASKDQDLKKKSTVSFYRTMQLFYKKHYQHTYPFFVTWIILRVLDMRIYLIEKG
jgi:GT2 family glycosyltransferase